MQEIDDFFRNISEKDANGTLTVGEAIFGYWRLLEGEHANRVIILSNAKIDGKPVAFFANGLTWTFRDKIANIRCESTRPTFTVANKPVDYSKSTWYPDGSNHPMTHSW